MALLALVLVTAVWGVTFVQVKDAVAVYPLFAFLTLRFAIASAVLAAPAVRRLSSLGRTGEGWAVGLGLLLAGSRRPGSRARRSRAPASSRGSTSS